MGVRIWYFLSGIILLSAFAGCKSGELLPNQPPVTRLFVEQINLTGDRRLNSAFRLFWSGDDADGYVTGFEISVNQREWAFTTRTDSLFRFDIPFGSDTANIDFRVRAVDNEGLADPNPPRLILPIRNSPPVARFDTLTVTPDTVYSVGTFLYTVSDIDGFDTIDSVYLRANGGPWVSLPRNVSIVTAVGTSPGTSGGQSATLFSGAEAARLPAFLPGWQVGAPNRLYLRAKDQAGVFSATDSTPVFFVRRQTAPLLLVDDHSEAAVDTFYAAQLRNLGLAYDYLRLSVNSFNLWDPTFTQVLGLYDKVVWYSDGAERTALGGLLLMEAAAFSIQKYLNSGGKALITVRFPNRFNNALTGRSSAIFGFSPLDSLSSAPGQARILTGALIAPRFGLSDTLECAQIVSGADPFYAKNPADDLYFAPITPTGGWQGPNTICGVSRFANSQINQIFWSVELHRLSRRPMAMRNFMDWALNQAFDW